MPEAAARTVVIDSSNEWGLPNLAELWYYRELLLTLTLRDIRVRYKQTVIGIAWAVLQPFVTMVVFTVIFGGLAKIPSDGVPYAVFSMTAILPWQLFARSVTQGSLSLVSLGGMMSKIYFPRLLAPVSSVLAGLVDFAIAFVILLLVMWFYGVVPGVHVFALPFFILLAVATAVAVSLWLTGINVTYRDVQHGLPFMAQIWMYVTPVVYPLSMIPESYRPLYLLNPMAGVVEGFRFSLLGQQNGLQLSEVAMSTAVVFALLFFGLKYFNRVEKEFVDRL